MWNAKQQSTNSKYNWYPRPNTEGVYNVNQAEKHALALKENNIDKWDCKVCLTQNPKNTRKNNTRSSCIIPEGYQRRIGAWRCLFDYNGHYVMEICTLLLTIVLSAKC